MPDPVQGGAATRRAPSMVQMPAAANQNPQGARRAAGEGVPEGGPWLLVLDVKTVPDRAIMPPQAGHEAAQANMPKPMYHKVAALGFLRARVVQDGGERLVVEECRAGGRPDTAEADLLAGFWKSFEGWKPKLVTFNGRGFGLPVLKYRSMRNRLQAKYLQDAGDRWSGYGNRYSLTHHVDMMDVLADHHASPFPSFADVAAGLALPRRADGPETEALLSEGRVEEVRADAECDAATTFLAYLRWRLFTGGMTPEGHDASVASLVSHVAERGEARRKLAAMLAGWHG